MYSLCICVCGATDSICFPTRRCVDCRAQDKYMYHCPQCGECGNYGTACESCAERDILQRVDTEVRPAEKQKEKEKKEEKVKRTRLPDKFNSHGKPRVSRQDKYLPLKQVTSDKKKGRTMLRRIKYTECV